MRLEWIHVLLDVPASHDPKASPFWAQATGWQVGDPWAEHPELASFEPSDGTAYLHRQLIDGDPRVHLDLAVHDHRQAAPRLVDAGAAVVTETAEWIVMSSPGGLPFCLVPHRFGNTRPAARTWPGGHRSRLVQACIDSPPGLHDPEVDFWRRITGWRWSASSGPEFAGTLSPPRSGPIQLLLQRLDADAPSTRAHLDLGTDDIEAEASRLIELGASRLWPGLSWIALRDPAGLPFCVTGNSPDGPEE
jgi:hypothetical protein